MHPGYYGAMGLWAAWAVVFGAITFDLWYWFLPTPDQTHREEGIAAPLPLPGAEETAGARAAEPDEILAPIRRLQGWPASPEHTEGPMWCSHPLEVELPGGANRHIRFMGEGAIMGYLMAYAHTPTRPGDPPAGIQIIARNMAEREPFLLTGRLRNTDREAGSGIPLPLGPVALQPGQLIRLSLDPAHSEGKGGWRLQVGCAAATTRPGPG